MPNCTHCKSQHIEELAETIRFSHQGKTLQAIEYYTHCNHCGAEYVTYEQAKKGDKSADLARRQADGLLMPQEIKAIRAMFNLTQKDASQIFGGGKNAFAKYECGEVRQSAAMDKLLRVVKNHPELLAEL